MNSRRELPGDLLTGERRQDLLPGTIKSPDRSSVVTKSPSSCMWVLTVCLVSS